MYRRSPRRYSSLKIGLGTAAPRNHPFRANRSDYRRNVCNRLRTHGGHANFKLGHTGFHQGPSNRHPIRSRQHHACGLFAVAQSCID